MDRSIKAKILEELGGISETIYDDLVKEFTEEAQRSLAVFTSSISKGDHEAVARLAHTLKGSSGNLRLYDIQEAAKYLEGAARERRDNKEMGIRFDIFCDALAKLKMP